MTSYPANWYVPVLKSEVPQGIVWDTPLRCQGQIVERQYSTGVPVGQAVNYSADEGDAYLRYIDHSVPGGEDSDTYYARCVEITEPEAQMMRAIDSTYAYQPPAALLSVANGLIGKGLVEVAAGFSYLILTYAGSGALQHL
jgi:hypothetical protein